MKLTLQLKLSQHLTLTPQLQQSIRLLQLSTLELNQEVERFLQENPLLEKEEGGEEQALPVNGAPRPQNGYTEAEPAQVTEPDFTHDAVDASQPDWLEDETPHSALRDDEETDFPQLAAESPSLREHLNWQLGMTHMAERDKKLVSLLVDALNEDGYLMQDLDELAGILPEELAIDPEELKIALMNLQDRDEQSRLVSELKRTALQIALKHLQQLDPPGVGARDLKECLALQLETLPDDTPYRQEALVLVKEHLDALASRDFGKLKKMLRCDEGVLRSIQHLITSLNPRPGADFSKLEARYVVPDVIVKKANGAWVAGLNPEAMPRLRINRVYADILNRNRESGHQQLAAQLQEAKWLIKNVQQRFETILRVSQAIVDRQRRFFEHGAIAMRPLVLREIADALDLHESTVSRVTTQKFMLTPRGILELKYFFGSHVATETGGAASSTAIRALIKQLVNAENATKPLSDAQITQILGQQGIVVARRTVAKYRESLQILPLNLRKSL